MDFIRDFVQEGIQTYSVTAAETVGDCVAHGFVKT